MEIIIGVILLCGIVYFAYIVLNKERADGTHPLDSITKPVEEKQPAEVYEPVYEPVKVADGHRHPAPKARKAPAKKVAGNVTATVAKQAKKRVPAKPASK